MTQTTKTKPLGYVPADRDGAADLLNLIDELAMEVKSGQAMGLGDIAIANRIRAAHTGEMVRVALAGVPDAPLSEERIQEVEAKRKAARRAPTPSPEPPETTATPSSTGTGEPKTITALIAETTDDEALARFAEAMQDAERDNEAEEVVVPYHVAYKVVALAFDHPSRSPGAPAGDTAFIERNELAVHPQVGGGWVISTSAPTGGGDFDVVELARTRESLSVALALAAASLRSAAPEGTETKS